jgi:hypothetical protein
MALVWHCSVSSADCERVVAGPGAVRACEASSGTSLSLRGTRALRSARWSGLVWRRARWGGLVWRRLVGVDRCGVGLVGAVSVALWPGLTRYSCECRWQRSALLRSAGSLARGRPGRDQEGLPPGGAEVHPDANARIPVRGQFKRRRGVTRCFRRAEASSVRPIRAQGLNGAGSTISTAWVSRTSFRCSRHLRRVMFGGGAAESADVGISDGDRLLA